MKCKDMLELIARYLDGDVTPSEVSRINEHLLACSGCREEMERLSKLSEQLQTEPLDDFKIDLTTSFIRESKKLPVYRQFAFPTISRKWAAVCAVALLMVFAGAIGGYLKNPSTLYISNPRDYSPSVASSMAIAADFAENRPTINPMLASDLRLKSIIDLQARGETLKRITEVLSAKTGVDISVSSDLESQLLYLSFSDMPTNAVLSEIAALTCSDWIADPSNTTTGYKLVCSESVKKMAAAIAGAQAISEASELLQKFSDAVLSRNLVALDNTQIYDTARTVLEFKRSGYPLEGGFNDKSMFALIDNEVISSLASGEDYTRTYAQLLQKYDNTEWLQNCVKHFRLKLDSTIRISFKRGSDESISLYMEVNRDGCTEGIGVGLWSLDYASDSTNSVTNRNLDRIWNEAISRNPAYSSKWLKVRLGNQANSEPPYKSKKGTYTLLQMLELLSERMNMQIAADYYTIQKNRHLILPREMTIGEMLALVDSKFGISWSLSPNGVLRLVHRQWPMLRKSEPPMELVHSVDETIHNMGRPTLDQMADLSKLSEIQFRGAIAALNGYEINSLISNVVDNFRYTLRSYADLTPRQRRMAESEGGLPSSEMSEEQRYKARLGAHMMTYNNIENYKPEEQNNQFNFSIRRINCTGRDIEKITGFNYFRGDSICTSSGCGSAWRFASGTNHLDPNAKLDYTIFHYSGAYDAYGVFPWE